MPTVERKRITGRWQQSGGGVGLSDRLKPAVAKRTSTDATVTDVQSERGAERLRANRKKKARRANE